MRASASDPMFSFAAGAAEMIDSSRQNSSTHLLYEARFALDAPNRSKFSTCNWFRATRLNKTSIVVRKAFSTRRAISPALWLLGPRGAHRFRLARKRFTPAQSAAAATSQRAVTTP